MAVTQKRTYHIEVRNNRGKVVLERDLNRSSQWSAHTALRRLFADQPTGSKATMSVAGKPIEEFVMHSEGWEFSVLNGDSVSAASRKARGVKDGLPKQAAGEKQPRKGKSTGKPANKPANKPAGKVAHRKPAKPVTKAARVASKAKRSAEAPF